MANTRDLRRRIKSVKSTAQITKAMQMVAASKMKKAQNQALSGRPYSFNLSSAISRLLPLIHREAHPFLTGNTATTSAVVLLSTNKGLCGALNTNLFRFLANSGMMSADTVFYTYGKKGRNFVARTGKNLQADFENLDVITFRQAVQMSKLLIDTYSNNEIKDAYLVYPGFVSTLQQVSVKVKILPIDLESVIAGVQEEALETGTKSEYLFEPDPDKLLDYILLHYVRIRVYQSLLETKAAEHSARMIAMQSATDNALELVDDLKLTYNQTRQDAITRELSEITTASLAMT